MVVKIGNLEVEQITSMLLMVDLYGKSEVTRNIGGFVTNHDFAVVLALGCDPILHILYNGDASLISQALRGGGLFPLIQFMNRKAYRRLGNMYREVDIPLGNYST